MRKHTEEFKAKIKEFGRQLDSKITFGETVLGNEQLNAVTPVLQSALLKSVMKELDIDSNVDIPVGTIINYKFGILLDTGEYEYLDYGNYKVYSSEKQEDNNAYNIVAYDKMLNSMVDYIALKDTSKTFPMTVRDYIGAICNDIDLVFVNNNTEFANYDKIIQSDLYANLGYTYRDILDELAQVTASNIIINENDELEIKYVSSGKSISSVFNKKPFIIEDAGPYDIKEFKIYGKSEQDVTFQQESDNLFDINLWKNGKIGVNQGNIVIDDNSITMSNPTAKDQYNTGTFHGNATPTEDQINIVKKYGIEVTPSTLYTLSYDNENSTLSQCFIFWYDENYVYISNANLYSADARCVLTANSSINAKYATIRFDNEGYETEQTELKISKISFKIGKDGTYSKFVSPKPSPNYPSEIESVRGIENLFDKNNLNIIDGKYLNATGYETSNSGFCITQYIPIEQGKYTYSGLTVEPGWAAKMCLYDANKTFLGYKGQTSSDVLTIDSKAKYIRFSFSKEEKESFMLERGKVAHKYVPYGNWLPINVTGKNIFDGNNKNFVFRAKTNTTQSLKLSSKSTNSVSFLTASGSWQEYFIDVNGLKPDTQYSLSYIVSVNETTFSPSINISNKGLTDSSGSLTLSFELNNKSTNATANQNVTYDKIQLEQNEKITEYEPYKEQEILIDMAKKSLFDGIFSQGFISAQGVEGVVENQIYTPNYIKVQPNTKYIYSNDQNIKINYIALYDNDKQFLKRISCNAFEYTTDSDTYYIRFTNYNGSKIIPEDVTNAILLEAGDNYYELASLSDEDNIFDGIFEQGLIGQNGSINSSNTQQIYTLNYIPVNQNSRYVYSNDQNQKVNYLAKYDKNKNFIERVACSSSVFITDSSTYYIRFTNYIGSGITPDYITNATLVERKYDLPMPNIKDTLKIENGQAILTKNMGKYVFTGDEDLDADGGTVGVDYRHAIKISKLNIPQPNYGYRGNAISSHFIGKASNTEEFGSFYISSSWCVFTDKNKLYDLNGFKQFLKEQYNNGTPVTIYYALEKPIQYQLEPINIKLFEGYNNITIEDNYDIVKEAEIIYLGEDDTINEEYLKDTDVAFGEKYGPINSIVLSRSAGSDNIYLQDEQSIADNGLCELKIKDNQIMNFNDRDTYLPDILNKLDGIEFYINDFMSTGICYYEVTDRYNVSIDENIYKCIMFNDKPNITQGLEESIYTDLPEQAETDYTKADKTDRRINQTTLIVDKQNQKIEGLITNIEGNTEKITQLEATTDGLKTTVTTVTEDLTNTNKKVDNLETSINGLSTDFTDFKDNEYVKDKKYIQDQIDGAIQFWNGSEIPTLNNYPASDWTTENDKNNHRADIYTVIDDSDTPPKQGKSYRFDKIGDTWQWVELTDNELSAVQALAQQALDNSTTNSESITTLTSKTSELEQTDSSIKATVESLTNKTTVIEENLNNVYTIEQVEQLVLNAQNGVTNTFSEAGGNNIFRNTGLWFENYESDYLTNPYEFWEGNVIKNKNENAQNMTSLLLQESTLKQEQDVSNGNYTVSFKYKKLIPLATVKVSINGSEYTLDSTTDKEFITGIDDVQPLVVSTRHIAVSFISDTVNSCEIYDLMVNAGTVKLAYSQNQNETTTDTVNISKGITITSTNTDTTFKANADGIRTLDKNGVRQTEFTDTRMITKKATVEEEAQIVKVLIQEVNNQTWFTRL